MRTSTRFNSAALITHMQMVVLMAVLMVAPVSAQELFVASKLLPVAKSQVALIEAEVAVDVGLLHQRPEVLDLSLPDGDRYQAELTSFEARESGVTWRGTIRGQEFDVPASVTFTVHDGLLVGSIVTAGGIYEARPQPDRSHILSKVDRSSQLDCGEVLLPEVVDVEPAGSDEQPKLPSLGEIQPVLGSVLEIEPKAISRVDVLGIYSPSARIFFGGHRQMVANIQHAVDVANSAFINSAADVRLTLVRAREFQLSDSQFEDLPFLRSHAPINNLRDEVGADLVSAFIKGPAPFCGRGYLMTSVGQGFAPSAYSVTDIVVCSTLVFAHEVGHNLGLAHDPANAGAPQNQSFPWAYGHFVDQRFRTIMSYNSECTGNVCPRVPFFSHPGRQVDGLPTGIAGQRDNHRVLNSTGPVAARFRTLQATIDASFSYAPTPTAFGLPVTFTDTSSGQPDRWNWNFGDGGSSNQRNPSHTYSEPGTYTVSLTASRGSLTNTATTVLEVEGLAATWETTPSTPRAGLSTQFTDTSSGQPDTWIWDFGDGVLSSEQHPTHVYDQPGTYTVSLTSGRGVVFDTLTLDVEVQDATCASGEAIHCLNQDRFQVEVEWVDFDNRTGNGTVAPFASDDSGMFWFFDADNWELLVKVLDGCGVNNSFWVFSAATTNVGYTLRVTDVLTGVERVYENPLGTAASAVTDIDAFDTCDVVPPASVMGATPLPQTSSVIVETSPATTEAEPGLCVASDTQLCLAQNRFRLEMEWRDFQNATGNGQSVPVGSDSSGLMWFFTPDNWEVLAKVLDGCAINGHYWVFAAATTNVEYTLKVTDLETGEMRSYFNPLGNAAPAITDALAFATCP